ncbi:hypothetical protein ACFE04_015919 [Oxalis oulophora]
MNQFNSSSDSLSALITISPTTEQHGSPNSKNIYSREFQEMLDSFDQDDYRDESFKSSEKKRRLSFHQVKALEMNFEVENKLEPQRKAQLADNLGLQPRQVAIWFQNRRARWKTKILEKDYGLLKEEYDALKIEYNKLEHENQELNHKLNELKSTMRNGNFSIKEEVPETVNNAVNQSERYDVHHNDVINVPLQQRMSPASSSSALPLIEPCSSTITWSPNSVMDWFHNNLSNSRLVLNKQSQMMKVEEQSLFGGGPEESCNFFSVDQPPTLQSYFTNQ